MKKLLLILLALTLVPLSISAQTQNEGNVAGVLYGSYWTDDNFTSSHGGIKMGMQTAIDQEKGVWLRTVYSQFNFDPEPIQSLGISAIFQWYAGKKVTLWFVTGTEAYMAGENEGADFFTGIGGSRTLKTISNRGWTIKPKLSLFGEVSFTDAESESTGNFVQFDFGIMFNRGKK